MKPDAEACRHPNASESKGRVPEPSGPCTSLVLTGDAAGPGVQCYSWRMLKKVPHPTHPPTHLAMQQDPHLISTAGRGRPPPPNPTTGRPLCEPPRQCRAAHASSQPLARCDGICQGTGLAVQTATFSDSRKNPGGQLPRNPATRSVMCTCALTSQEATHLLSQVITSTRRREEHNIT